MKKKKVNKKCCYVCNRTGIKLIERHIQDDLRPIHGESYPVESYILLICELCDSTQRAKLKELLKDGCFS